jgi:cell wall-associated NlpC family hydrolase
MTQGTEVVAEAREWLGTRWHHQAAVKGVGTDCIGLVRGVCARLGLTPSDIMSSVAASPFIGYGRTPYEGRLESACATFFTPITAEQAKPGDMVLISFDSPPRWAFGRLSSGWIFSDPCLHAQPKSH